MGTKERLSICVGLLDVIDRHRARTQTVGRGCGIERRIIERELKELEDDIVNDPGALESQLVRVRQKRSGG